MAYLTLHCVFVICIGDELRELSDARGSGPRQGGGPGGGAPWLNTLEYQSTVKRQMTKNLPPRNHCRYNSVSGHPREPLVGPHARAPTPQLCLVGHGTARWGYGHGTARLVHGTACQDMPLHTMCRAVPCRAVPYHDCEKCSVCVRNTPPSFPLVGPHARAPTQQLIFQV